MNIYSCTKILILDMFPPGIEARVMLLLQIPCDGKLLSIDLIFELDTSRKILIRATCTGSVHAENLKEENILK